MKRAAEQQLKGILGYTTAPNVSIDFNHDPHSSTFHMDQTKVHGRHAGAGDVLVRQRMGLLQPHGRHRRGDGEAAVSLCVGIMTWTRVVQRRCASPLRRRPIILRCPRVPQRIRFAPERPGQETANDKKIPHPR
jgi:hypothetical protein